MSLGSMITVPTEMCKCEASRYFIALSGIKYYIVDSKYVEHRYIKLLQYSF